MERKQDSEEKKGSIAVVKIKGEVRLSQQVRDTFNALRLYRKNYCVVVPNSPEFLGMVNKVKDFVTWGEISDEVLNELVLKKGEEAKGDFGEEAKAKRTDYHVFSGKKIKKFFRLNSPRKGFGRKGIKTHFNKGGAIGYRGEKISDLIKRMM